MDTLPLTGELLTPEAWATALTMCVGLVFTYAVAMKCSDLRSYVSAVRDYDVIPRRLVGFFATLLIFCEASIAISHFVGVGMQIFVPGTFVLLSLFLLFLVQQLRRGSRLPCLCFGAARDESVNIVTLIRTSVLWLIEAILFVALMFIDDLAEKISWGASRSIELLFIATLAVTLVSWFFLFPSFVRAWRIVRF